MGLLPDDANDLTISELIGLYRGYNVRRAKDLANYRMLAWYSVGVYDTKSKFKSPMDLFRIDGVDPDESDLAEMGNDEVEEAKRIIAQYKAEGRI